jgi:hypothetical protein
MINRMCDAEFPFDFWLAAFIICVLVVIRFGSLLTISGSGILTFSISLRKAVPYLTLIKTDHKGSKAFRQAAICYAPAGFSRQAFLAFIGAVS